MKKFGVIFCVVLMCGYLSPVRGNCGFGYELLVARFEALEQMLVDQQTELQRTIESKVSSEIIKISQQNTELQRTLNNLQKNIDSKFLTQNSKINQQNGELKRSIESLRKNISSSFANQEVNAIKQKEKDDQKMISSLTAGKPIAVQNRNKTIADNAFRSCKDVPYKTSGQYLIEPFDDEPAFMGYCQQETFDGGWLVVQHRYDGSVDFFRNWTEYRNGFGQTDGEFWLGLERLHRLTKGKNHTMLVELYAFDGDFGYAMYDGFEIGSEAEDYSLKILGAYAGTAGDSLASHRGVTSSVDPWIGVIGGWWGRASSNLNAYHGNNFGFNTNFWHTFKKNNGLKISRMSIREN